MSNKYGKTKVSYDWENRRKWLDLQFPLQEYERRVDELRQAMPQDGLDYLLIYSNPSCIGPVRYIANFDSFFGNTMVVLPLSGEPSLVTDSVMHSEPMHTGIWMTWIRDVRAGHHPATVRRAENICDFVIDVLKQQSLQDGQGGLVSTRWFPHVFMSRLSELLPEIHLRPAESVFESVRGIKSDMEISALRQAAEFASLGLNVAFEKAAAGMTEKELRTEAVHAMLRAGADGATVALTSGPRSGLKQAEPSERRIEEGDMLFLDVAGPCQGYVSDVARAGVVGRPNDQQRKMLETALEMRDRVVEAVKPGARICDLQSIAEGIAARRGFADHYCPTGFGHGIGTSKVESPILFPDNEAQLEENMVFSLEPMIVIEGVGTAVFEDMILVTSSGAEILSDATTSTW
jgi:Xaa-Pro aminopeptidase